MNQLKLKKEYCLFDELFLQKVFGEREEIIVDEFVAKKMYSYSLSLSFLDGIKRFASETKYKKTLDIWLKLFPNSKMLEWNNEIIEERVKELEKMVSFKDEYDSDFHYCVGSCISFYINKELLCERIISIIEKVCKKYCYDIVIGGKYFSHCNFLISNLTANLFCYELNDFAKTKLKKDLSILSFFPEANFSGFMAILCYNHYFNLVYRMIDNILIPFLNSNFSQTSFCTDLIDSYYIYKSCRKCLSELGDEYVNYFDQKVNSSIKSFTPQKKFGIWDKGYYLNILKKDGDKFLLSRAYCLNNKIFVCNLSFLKSSKEKCTMLFKYKQDRFWIETEKDIECLSYEVLMMDDNLDIAIIKISNDCTSINPISSEMNSGKEKEFLYINGSKIFFNKYFTNVWSGNLNKGAWDKIFNWSYGEATNLNNYTVVCDAPFPNNIYGAVAYSKNEEPVGMVRYRNSFNEPLSITPFEIIYNLAKKYF